MKGMLAMGIPTFERKHSLLQSSDIPKHIWTVAEAGDFGEIYLGRCELFSLTGDHPRNILDPNEDWNQ